MFCYGNLSRPIQILVFWVGHYCLKKNKLTKNVTKTLPAGIKEDRKSGTNKGTLLDFRDSNEWDNRTIHLWTSVLQRKGRMIKRAIRKHSGISLLPQPLGARLFPEWFPKVRLAQCLWVRMLLPNAQGQDHPAELQRWDCHLEMWRWLLSPDTEPWARGFFWSFTTWWNFAWLEPVIHFYFQLLPFGMGPSVLCLSHLACILEAYKLSNFTGSQLERNSESGNTVPQVSPALDLHEI